MSVKYRVLAVLGFQAFVLLTVGITLLAASPKHTNDDHAEVRRTGSNSTNTSSDVPLERGTFSVPIQLPQQQSSTCLARASESRAWQCAFDTNLQLSILPSIGNDNKPIMVTLGLPSTSNRTVHCGQQAPEIGPTALTPLTDTDDGPQYHFSAIYDRTVILREEQLGPEKVASSPMQGPPKHTTFLPGTSLWRCTFNNTQLEGFIYTERDAEPVTNGTNATAGARPHLPYKLKLMERRVAAGSAPYCEKVTVRLDGELEVSGASVDLALFEGKSESGPVAGSSDTSCQCQWIVE
ncbi:hypothetical protein E8E12_004699 [Didymella heteroderae]|uniref:DUF7820 domain-containing protein n=1 Tax=Didymella heteroderae TaxID=1769908 RepID=A0A9P4WLT2_9PLEO|nr:hypothetical protein E8E12_004699 [Didymella heteroderae]